MSTISIPTVFSVEKARTKLDKHDTVYDSDYNQVLKLKKGMFNDDQISEIIRVVNIQRDIGYTKGVADKVNEIRCSLNLGMVDEWGDDL